MQASKFLVENQNDFYHISLGLPSYYDEIERENRIRSSINNLALC